MVSQKVKIKNPAGLHVHPAGALCQIANGFECRVTFRTPNGNVSNAKSLLSILGAGVPFGTELEFVCEGVDEQEALAKIVAAVETSFEDYV
ncbi:MAG: HPr family phosphocarrier protein [Eubacterium sp.]|nr:HPr family phosphocarrier protein [Eubacterium sp.]